MTTMAATVTSHLNKQTVGELIIAAGAESSPPFQRCQEVANVLESISILTGVPGFEGASNLIGTIPAEVDAEALLDIFMDHLEEFGKDLNSAIHSGSALPSILLLSEDTKNACAAMLAASRVQKFFFHRYGAVFGGGEKRLADPGGADEERYAKSALRFNSPATKISQPSGFKNRSTCYAVLLGGKCTRSGCERVHVKGVPGVDKCPFGETCNRKDSCLLAWSHAKPNNSELEETV